MDKITKSLTKLEQELNQSNLVPSKQYKSKLVGGTVCKYWLENRCKKGETCEYIHENIPDKLPECPHGYACTKGKDCIFKHTPKQIKECILYSNGYCKDGKNCKSAHIKKEICLNYLLGFCPEGPLCKNIHLKSMILPSQDNMLYLEKNIKNL